MWGQGFECFSPKENNLNPEKMKKYEIVRVTCDLSAY